MEINKPHAFLIDIDGTICDSRIPYAYLNGEKDKDNFIVYFRLLDKVTALKSTINEIKQLCKVIGGDRDIDPYREITLVFLTGRNAGSISMFHTMQFIERYFEDLLKSPRVKFDFYFRPINYHVSNTQYKMEKFSILKQLYYFEHIYEDEFLNIEMFNKHKQEKTIIHWVRNAYDFALEQQNISISKDFLNKNKIFVHQV